MSEIEKIVTTFKQGDKAKSIDMIDAYASSENIGVGHIFRDIYHATNYLCPQPEDFKFYADITVYYANNKGVL